MIGLQQFITWQAVPVPGGKPTKIPTDPKSRIPIDPHDPKNWLTYDQARATGLPVGFVLTDGDPYFCLDVDDAKDAAGNWDQRALDLLAMFPGAFSELSVSGNGFHVWGRADILALGPRRKKFVLPSGLKIEVYTDKRFIALGPNSNGGNPDLDWTALLASIVPVSTDSTDSTPLVDVADPAWSGPTNDEELIALMLSARGSIAAAFGDAASFADLWQARVDVLERVYPSTSGKPFDHSSADQALCNALAFWTGKNPARMDRLFRRSGLMRDKWERVDYSSVTISKAVQSTRNVYSRRPAVAPVGTTFDQVMTEARDISPADVEAIKRLCGEAAKLGAVEKATVLSQLKANTGLTMADLKKQAGSEENEPDHLEFARKAISKIGPENIIHVGQFSWKFSHGVWKRADDRELKKHVQATLAADGFTVTAPRISGVTDVMKTEIFRPDHEFNLGNSETVNCTNGELEFVNGQWLLHPHRRELYRTTQIPIAFDPTARAPLFERFLMDVFRDDQDRDDKIRVVLEMMGYSLMSHANREKFALLIGAGANGKSVLLATLEALLGKENVAGVQPSNFDNRFQRGHLDQKLANIISELKQGETIADAELKAITSGEAATVEHKGKDPFVMRPFATCWFGTNHMPHTRDYSDAFFRRALVIKFNRVFAPSEQDPNLKQKLRAELPGILNHALGAYAAVVVRNGFTVPASSLEAQRKWQVEADQVAQFVEDRCEPQPGATVGIGMLYSLYQGWAQATGVRNVLGQLQFGNRLEQLGYERTRTRHERVITGLLIRGLSV